MNYVPWNPSMTEELFILSNRWHCYVSRTASVCHVFGPIHPFPGSYLAHHTIYLARYDVKSAPFPIISKQTVENHIAHAKFEQYSDWKLCWYSEPHMCAFSIWISFRLPCLPFVRGGKTKVFSRCVHCKGMLKCSFLFAFYLKKKSLI